ncbi:hypothetical protein SDC9_136135 [bioreactor metagenome]|uniref:Uncharacterized protein n=1 Tax=bioreactor metagenome TaxID=1076179 RepID=A0A645DID8_9ZZZZ|nr:hypothetical protein [Victivallaceae bacterium]
MRYFFIIALDNETTPYYTSIEKEDERKALAAGAQSKARSFCNQRCCSELDIVITSNVTDGFGNSLLVSPREAKYKYSCKTSKITKTDNEKFYIYNPFFELPIPRED